MVELARDAIARYDMLGENETVVVAISGGPDSTCLLDVLTRLSTKLDLSLAVAHVDHGLSPDSAEIAARLSRQAAQSGHDVHVVRAPDLQGSNLQARARTFRYGFLDTVAANTGADRIATGHTLDDRVETTLARLIHGAGTEGLAGLPPVEGSRIRPLIAARRADTRAYCTERGLDFVDDPANADERFERVAVRSRLLRAIEEHWGPGAVEAIAASAERLREDAAALSSIADRLYADVARMSDGATVLDAEVLESLPRAVRRRLLEAAVGRVRDRSGGIEAALDALDRSPRSEGRFAVAGGIEILVSGSRVAVVKPH
jgi:tRNA(Ile)-lysidine synthase